MIVLLAMTGCGGDNEPAKPSKAPELTVPETQSRPETTGTTPSTTTPSTTTTPATPPPTTPERRFERFCDENPGACG